MDGAANPAGAALPDGPEDESSDASSRRHDRILIVAREFTRGGAAYLALRHARRLSGHYAVDLLVTGPCDDDFLAGWPAGGRILRDANELQGPAPPSSTDLHQYVLGEAERPPAPRPYRAALATSIFPDLVACAAFNSMHAARRLVFLVDESLAWYSGLGPDEREVVGRCLLDADLVLPVSRRLWGRMAELCPILAGRPWKALRPPVDVERLRKDAKAPQDSIVGGGLPVVLTIARLNCEKQIGLCLRVHHRLKREGVHFRWYVVGSGPEGPALREEIGQLGMDSDFIILGYQENVYSLVKACDVFALFSATEGCPTVVVEAVALGCPVIMTDVNGSEELVERETTGLVVGHDADAIAAGLARIVLDGDLRSRFRAALAARPPGREDERLGDLIEGLPAVPTPDVSILIPTYNQREFIDKAIASALMQDHPSIEVVVLDDASTDGTGLAARAWEYDRRFRYVRNGRNVGRVENYRRGVAEHARGRWVVMLDGDDYLADPGVIGRAREAIARHPDRAIVFAQAGHRVRHLDGIRADIDVLPPIDGNECVLPGGEYLRFLFETAFFTHLGAIFNRELAVKIGFYTSPISSSDMDSLLRLALEGDVLLLNTIAGCWVQHGTNTSSNLPLHALAANAGVFRKVAREAVRRGLATWRDLDGPLTKYEARTLVHLFGTMIGRSARGPLALLRLAGIALGLNPRLFLEESFRDCCLRSARPLLKLWLGRSRVGNLTILGSRRLRIAGAKARTRARAVVRSHTFVGR